MLNRMLGDIGLSPLFQLYYDYSGMLEDVIIRLK